MFRIIQNHLVDQQSYLVVGGRIVFVTLRAVVVEQATRAVKRHSLGFARALLRPLACHDHGSLGARVVFDAMGKEADD